MSFQSVAALTLEGPRYSESGRSRDPSASRSFKAAAELDPGRSFYLDSPEQSHGPLPLACPHRKKGSPRV